MVVFANFLFYFMFAITLALVVLYDLTKQAFTRPRLVIPLILGIAVLAAHWWQMDSYPLNRILSTFR